MSNRFVRQVEPEAAFAALADETRLRILQVLWESDVQTLTFSELRRAVGMRDPGQFNYHLNKLMGQFVTKTDEGYRLTQAGKYVNGAIASGMYTAHGTIDPIVLDHSCQKSGEEIMLRYENETVQIGCGSCSICPSGWEAPVPPAVFDGYDWDKIPEIVGRYFRTKVHQVINGFCPFCNGQMQPTVELIDTIEESPSSEDGPEDPNGQSLDPVVRFDCQRCGAESQVALYHALLVTDPAVASFYHENGVVVQKRPVWEFAELSPTRVDIESRDPIKVNMAFRVDESSLRVVVDKRFNILDIET